MGDRATPHRFVCLAHAFFSATVIPIHTKFGEEETGDANTYSELHRPTWNLRGVCLHAKGFFTEDTHVGYEIEDLS